VVTVLHIRTAKQEPDADAAERTWASKLNPDFTTKLRTPYGQSTVTRIFKYGTLAARARVIWLHDIRHTSASLLAALGIHPPIAMAVLRHSQIALTIQVYNHWTGAKIRRALEQLAAAIFK
jgi:integrase